MSDGYAAQAQAKANLTTEQRRDVRLALMERGFRRLPGGTSMDDGFGRYTETFVLADTKVYVSWGPKPEGDDG